MSTEPAPKPPNLLDRVVGFCDRRLGPSGVAGLLMVLAALTGRTRRPASAGTCGPSRNHGRIGQAVEALLGEQAVRFESATPAGILSLHDSKHSVIIDEPGAADAGAIRLLNRLVRGESSSHLDASADGNPRFRTLSRRLACVLVGVDDTADLDGRILLLPVRDDRSAADFDALRRLEPFRSPSGGEDLVDNDATALKSELDGMAWTSPVSFAGLSAPTATSASFDDTDRLGVVLAIASVVAILKAGHRSQAPLAGSSEHVEFVVRLIESARAADQRRQLIPGDATFLELLRRNAQPGDPDLLTKFAGDLVTGEADPFTLYTLKNRPAFAHVDLDVMADRLKRLEAKGFVRDLGLFRRKRAWTLTPQGAAYGTAPLAAFLRTALRLPNSGNSGPSPATRPTDFIPPQTAAPDPSAGNSGTSAGIDAKDTAGPTARNKECTYHVIPEKRPHPAGLPDEDQTPEVQRFLGPSP